MGLVKKTNIINLKMHNCSIFHEFMKLYRIFFEMYSFFGQKINDIAECGCLATLGLEINMKT